MTPFWLRGLTQSPEGYLWDVTLNAGVGGVTGKTDVIGGVHTQVVKLQLGAATVDGGLISTSNPVPTADYPTTSGGGSDYHKVAAGSNNAANIKNAAGQVYGVQGINLALYPVYVKLYDKASAPNPAADTPVRTIAMQSGVRCDDDIPKGLAFVNGISIAIVKGIADNDNTSVVANDCVVDVDYK
jgi:hypothetical protein